MDTPDCTLDYHITKIKKDMCIQKVWYRYASISVLVIGVLFLLWTVWVDPYLGIMYIELPDGIIEESHNRTNLAEYTRFNYRLMTFCIFLCGSVGWIHSYMPDCMCTQLLAFAIEATCFSATFVNEQLTRNTVDFSYT